jgi:hypothetical protein
MSQKYLMRIVTIVGLFVAVVSLSGCPAEEKLPDAKVGATSCTQARDSSECYRVGNCTWDGYSCNYGSGGNSWNSTAGAGGSSGWGGATSPYSNTGGYSTYPTSTTSCYGLPQASCVLPCTWNGYSCATNLATGSCNGVASYSQCVATPGCTWLNSMCAMSSGVYPPQTSGTGNVGLGATLGGMQAVLSGQGLGGVLQGAVNGAMIGMGAGVPGGTMYPSSTGMYPSNGLYPYNSISTSGYMPSGTISCAGRQQYACTSPCAWNGYNCADAGYTGGTTSCAGRIQSQCFSPCAWNGYNCADAGYTGGTTSCAGRIQSQCFSPCAWNGYNCADAGYTGGSTACPGRSQYQCVSPCRWNGYSCT